MTVGAREPGSGEAQLLPFPRWLVLGVLFLAALGIRLYHISDPPLDFHATRQYRSLIIARGLYFDQQVTAAPEWKRSVAQCSRANQGVLEPPIMESVVAMGYRLLGGERLWLPRLLSIAAWLAGGGLLYLIGRQVAGDDAALFGTAFHLLLPFATVASRSFQPDPTMVMVMLAGVWAILRYDSAPSARQLVTAALVSSLAFVIKPGSVFVLAATFLALAVHRQGHRRALWSRPTAMFLGLTLLPTLLIYTYSVLRGSFLLHEAQKTVLPQLWLSPFFWRGWLMQISSTVGFVCFIAALLGVFTFRPGRPRTLMLALWAGYVAFALVLNYNLATHDYYQLQLVPIVGLSLGPIVAIVMHRLHDLRPAWYWRVAIWSTWGLALALSLADARARLVRPLTGRQVARQAEVGERVRHSRRTIFLSADYGVPLEYNGALCGKSWPISWDLEWERLAGVRSLPAEERFQRWYAVEAPEYFIVEDLREFAGQPDLEQFLSRFPVVARTDDYVIYALSRK